MRHAPCPLCDHQPSSNGSERIMEADKIVWRWEHRFWRTGPYHNSDFIMPDGTYFGWWISNQHEDSAHPVAYEDGLYEEIIDKAWYVATLTRESLDEWFADVPEGLLRSAGYVIRTYRVPAGEWSPSASGRQVAYNPREATLMG